MKKQLLVVLICGLLAFYAARKPRAKSAGPNIPLTLDEWDAKWNNPPLVDAGRHGIPQLPGQPPNDRRIR